MGGDKVELLANFYIPRIKYLTLRTMDSGKKRVHCLF
jgi:hypothetical protein